jgi:phosphatidylinositol glycan class H protein
MLTTTAHLRTRRPSPTTVEYTVSTSPVLTLPLRLVLLTTLFLRISIGLSVLLLLYSRFLLSTLSTPLKIYTTTPNFLSNDYIWHSISRTTSSPLGRLSSNLAQRTPLIILGPLSLGILYCCFLRIHTTESLLVLRGLGIQTSTSSETYLSTATTRFIPTEKIQDILVNEAFRGFEVRYYLVVVVEGEEDVIVVFPRLLPRRVIVEKVWRGVRGALFEPVDGGGKEREKG